MENNQNWFTEEVRPLLIKYYENYRIREYQDLKKIISENPGIEDLLHDHLLERCLLYCESKKDKYQPDRGGSRISYFYTIFKSYLTRTLIDLDHRPLIRDYRLNQLI